MSVYLFHYYGIQFIFHSNSYTNVKIEAQYYSRSLTLNPKIVGAKKLFGRTTVANPFN